MKFLRIVFFIILFLIYFTNITNVFAYEDKLVNSTVYYNDQKASVFDAVLKVGEPFTIRVVVLLKKNVDVSAALDASGFDVRTSSQPFEVISFPTEFSATAKMANMPIGFTRTTREFNHTAGETVEIKWILKPTEVGKGWTVPLNIAFNFYDRDKGKQVPFSFTVANIEIKNEYYAGASSKPTPPPQPRESTPDATTQPKSTPFPSALLALAALLAVWRLKYR